MLTFKLKKKDAYDLSLVSSVIVRDKSESLDFKEVLHLQKAANDILSFIPDFSDAYDKISKEKSGLAEVANKKISEYKAEQLKNVDAKVNPEAYKKKVEEFTQMMVEETTLEAQKLITPQFDALYEGIGMDEVELSLEKDRLDVLVDNFEKYAKEKYTNKNRMIEVYEILKAAA